MFHTLKAWKDHLTHQKFLMASGLLALQFKSQIDTSLVKVCFDAMRQHKEQEKFLRTHQILTEQELPAIQSLSNETEDITAQSKFKAKKHVCEQVKSMLSKSLFMYFNRWKQETDDYKEKLRTTIKDRIIKCYMETIRIAFQTWRVNHNGSQVEQHQIEVDELHSDQTALTNEVIQLQKEIKDKVEQRSGQQSKNVSKCVQSYQKRMLQIAVGRWRDKISQVNVKEGGADTIIKRLRLRYLRQAFDLYKEGVHEKKKAVNDEERCS